MFQWYLGYIWGMSGFKVFLQLLIALIMTPTVSAEGGPGGHSRFTLTSVERIWAEAPHSAFTDLLQVDDRLFCVFREGDDHVGGVDGRIRVIVRNGEGPWRSVALLAESGVDLRDPKLARMPDGRIMVICGGSFYEGSTLLKAETRTFFSDSEGKAFGAPEVAVIDERIRSNVDWLWRVTWHDGVGYGVVYQPRREGSPIHLVATRDGIHYSWIGRMPLEGNPNETTLRFRGNGDMVALVRREGGDHTACLGSSSAPYTSWTFTPLPEPIGGPNLIGTGDDTWLLAGRRYRPGETRTALFEVGVDTAWSEIVTLPSGGDTSYPGLVFDGRTLLVSYYSSHEDRTAIYLATLTLNSNGDGAATRKEP